MRSYILSSIIKRDLKETYRNPQTLIILGITVGINVFMALAIGQALWVMTFAMSLVMIGFSVTSFMITEEKEKKTLEALLVSPASYEEILFGKLFLTYFLTVFVSLSLIFLLHYKEISIIHTLISLPFGALVICLFGVVTGLVCPSQAVLSGIGTVLSLSLFLPEILAPTNVYLGHLARALPTHHVVQIANLGKEGFSIVLMKHYGMLLLSLLVSIIWVLSFVKKAARQESSVWKFERSNKVSSFLLLLTLVFSSYVFLPVKGEVVQTVNGEHRYVNKKSHISVPTDPVLFKMDEYHFQNKILVKFTLNSSPEVYLYLSIKKNLKRVKHGENLKTVMDRIKKENVFNLKVMEKNFSGELIASRLEYETANGRELFYLFESDEFLYTFGIDVSEKESERFSSMRDHLEKYIRGVEFLEKP